MYLVIKKMKNDKASGIEGIQAYYSEVEGKK